MDLKCTKSAPPEHPAATPELTDVRVVNQKSFWRQARDNANRNGFSVVSGFAGGPLVIYGDGATRHSLPSTMAVTPQAADRNDGYVSKAGAEAILNHGRGYLSRKKRKDSRPMWEELGLKPRRSGNKLLFRQIDLYAHLESHIARKRGRPRQVTANVAA